MAKEADAIAVGTIAFVRRESFDCGFKPNLCTADYTHIVVSDSFKGVAAGDSVLVRAVRVGSNLDWYEPMPVLEPGKSYLMFLKKDAVGYYPFRGFNGFLEVRGDSLIQNGHVPYTASKSQVADAVREALKP